MKMKSWITITALALVMFFGAFFVGRSSNSRGPESPIASAVPADSTTVNTTATIKHGTELGNLAPEFQVLRLDGSKLSLSDLRGQPAVLVFWAAWCPFCKEEAPHVNKLAEAYESRGVHVYGIDVQDSQARTEWGVKNFGIRYSVVRDGSGEAARNYNVNGIPTVIFLDRKGVVRYIGNRVANDYTGRLDALLAEHD